MTTAFLPGEMTTADIVSNVFVEIATLLIVFGFGAMVGSFLNVVLYRMPRRINLLWPPSRCPHCLHRLSLTDNLPVVSWLSLRGACRYCGAAIPRSYLRVEVRTGLLFLFVMYAEIHTGGRNLPLRTPNHYVGALWTIWYPQFELLKTFGYHLVLAGFLAALYLFARRGERFPGTLVVAGLFLGVFIAMRVPFVQQVPWNGMPMPEPGANAHQVANAWRAAGGGEAFIGLAVGAIVGVFLGLAWKPRTTEPGPAAWLAIPPRWDAAVLLAFVGTWFGWQAAVSVAVLAALLGWAFRRPPPAVLLIRAVAVQFVCWRALTTYAPWWPGPHTPFAFAAGWLVVAALAAKYRPDPPPEAVTTDTPEPAGSPPEPPSRGTEIPAGVTAENTTIPFPT